MLSRIDMARAFRNLKVYPVDAFKFWHPIEGQILLRIHVSALFQMASDAILYMMRQEDCSTFLRTLTILSWWSHFHTSLCQAL